MSIPSSTPHADRVASSTVYKPDDPALADNFVEFSNSWSRAQSRAAWEAWALIPEARGTEEAEAAAIAAEDKLLAVLRPKIVTLRLDCPDADPITDPARLTSAATDAMDQRVYLWWVNVWIVHLRGLADLGNALGRQLFNSSATPPATPTTKPTQPTKRRPSRKS